MRMKVNFCDIIKLETMMDDFDFVNKMLVPLNGYWHIHGSTKDIREMRALLKSRDISYELEL